MMSDGGLTQAEILTFFQNSAMRTGHALKDMNDEHIRLDAEHAVLSPEEAALLIQAERIVKTVREKLRMAITNQSSGLGREGLGVDGGR